MQFAALTDIGRQLDHNEGNYLTLQTDPTNGLFVVADGMGEYVAGQVGSQVAVDELRQRATTEWAQLQNGVNSAIVRGVFHRWIKAANEKIYSAAQRQGNNMGATLTGALIINRHVYIANVGDSRTYLVRGGELYPLTWDHSRVASLVRAGLLEPDRIYDHPQRNEVFRALGQKSDVSIDVFDPVELALGDCVLACSDGLWKMVRPPQMKVIFARVVDPTACCAELVRTANQNGGEDNITVIIVRVV
jgi:serine/threonine protein phosphatase PrpC